MLSIYSLPAILALVVKFAVLYFSRRSSIKDFKVVVFQTALIISIALGALEAIGLNMAAYVEQRGYDFFGFGYFVLLVAMLATLTHLAVCITFGNSRLSNTLATILYGYTLVLVCLLLFTTLVVERFEPFQGYTVTRVPGPALALYEIFVLMCVSTMILLPVIGLRASRPAIGRNQCKLWIAGASPTAVLLAVVIAMLHSKIRLFNFSVTSPLLIALLLTTAGYAVHSRRPIELDFYFPWSRTRRHKKAFYNRLDRLARELSSLRSPEQVLKRLAKTLRCPVCLIQQNDERRLQGGDAAQLASFPVALLPQIDRMVVTAELPDSDSERKHLLEKYRVGAVVPFFPKCQAACWLMLDRNFSERIYTPRDFAAATGLFDRLAMLLLDQILSGARPVTDLKDEVSELRNSQEHLWAQMQRLLPTSPIADAQTQTASRPLDEWVAEFEKGLIEKVLAHCQGHKSKAAQLLGLNPSTLHYKLERYGLVVPLYQRKRRGQEKPLN